MRNFFRFGLVSLALLALGAGCQTTQPTGPAVFPQAVTDAPVVTSTPAARLPDGMDLRTATYNDGRIVRLAVAALSSDKWEWHLANDPTQPKNVQDWHDALKAGLVVNGTYFSEDFKPSGYYHLPATTTTGIAWPDSSIQNDIAGYTGMIRVRDGKLSLAYLPDAYQTKPNDQDAVALTFPTLVDHGQPTVTTDSGKFGRRTVLAQDADGKSYAIATQDGVMSLYEISQWLASQPEHFSMAVNLDGGQSTGMSYEKDGNKFDIPSVQVPNVVWAKLKP